MRDPIPDDPVAKVAKAIYDAHYAEYDEEPSVWWCEQLARAAIKAMEGEPAADQNARKAIAEMKAEAEPFSLIRKQYDSFGRLKA